MTLATDKVAVFDALVLEVKNSLGVQKASIFENAVNLSVNTSFMHVIQSSLTEFQRDSSYPEIKQPSPLQDITLIEQGLPLMHDLYMYSMIPTPFTSLEEQRNRFELTGRAIWAAMRRLEAWFGMEQGFRFVLDKLDALIKN